MAIKMVVEVDRDYEPMDFDSPFHPLALARECIEAAVEAASRWGSQRDAYAFLISELEERRRSLPASMLPVPARYGFKKQPIPRAVAKQVFERDAYRCVRCASWTDLTVDHIHPESKGGPLTLDNLQTLCRSCNSAKGDR